MYKHKRTLYHSFWPCIDPFWLQQIAAQAAIWTLSTICILGSSTLFVRFTLGKRFNNLYKRLRKDPRFVPHGALERGWWQRRMKVSSCCLQDHATISLIHPFIHECDSSDQTYHFYFISIFRRGKVILRRKVDTVCEGINMFPKKGRYDLYSPYLQIERVHSCPLPKKLFGCNKAAGTAWISLSLGLISIMLFEGLSHVCVISNFLSSFFIWCNSIQVTLPLCLGSNQPQNL